MSDSWTRACSGCLKRSWLIGRLAGHLEPVRERIGELLALPDDELLLAVGGRHREQLEGELRRLDVAEIRAASREAGLEMICGCDGDYPSRLRALDGPPAVLHVAGGLSRFLELTAHEPVALVGARRSSEYGLEVARDLGRALGSAGVTVISGMAYGIDSAAHTGALDADAPTIAVLPSGAERPYPRGKRALYRRIRAAGVVVSELAAGAAARRWSFPARNRIIAGLCAMTVVVEGRRDSGALVTAAWARELGRPVGAVPGRITSPLAAGSNALLADGAGVVRGPQDVLDALFGPRVRIATLDARPPLDAELKGTLAAIGDGHDTIGALARAGVAPQQALAALGALELSGHVRREAGGRYSVVP